MALHLTGLRDDGYHLLDSLVVFADVGDRIEAVPDDTLSLTVAGPFAKGVPVDGSNLVLKAAQRLRDLRGLTRGAALHLDKYLPHGGGIGGGSSDAAATIRVLADLWDVHPLTAQEALPLGADIPVCLAAPRPMFMRGIGDVLEPANGVPEGWLVLVNPGVPVSTQDAFKVHDALYPVENPPLADFWFDKDLVKFETWLLGERNDLTKVACDDQIAPVISKVLESLQSYTTIAEMSGSGSTCWGWFRTRKAAEDAADGLSRQHPEWWVQAAGITGSS
ncbi:4-diphosphocytidyl-2-C-methyl-D-erythritol kinase [Sulfitobacter noctilucae]|nr:4-diphosphocytidyl-2-C-methyl-D-erythritol kinase [Sulfitobacter noctilucae]